MAQTRNLKPALEADAEIGLIADVGDAVAVAFVPAGAERSPERVAARDAQRGALPGLEFQADFGAALLEEEPIVRGQPLDVESFMPLLQVREDQPLPRQRIFRPRFKAIADGPGGLDLEIIEGLTGDGADRDA